jgi:hypothetical protein
MCTCDQVAGRITLTLAQGSQQATVLPVAFGELEFYCKFFIDLHLGLTIIGIFKLFITRTLPKRLARSQVHACLIPSNPPKYDECKQGD